MQGLRQLVSGCGPAVLFCLFVVVTGNPNDTMVCAW